MDPATSRRTGQASRQRREPGRLRALLPALALMAAITWSSSIPGEVDRETGVLTDLLAWVDPGVQNLVHLPVFALLALLLARAGYAAGQRTARAGTAAIAITVLFGLADEWHQAFVPGRYSTATDVLLDALGAAIGVVIAHLLRARLATAASGR